MLETDFWCFSVLILVNRLTIHLWRGYIFKIKTGPVCLYFLCLYSLTAPTLSALFGHFKYLNKTVMLCLFAALWDKSLLKKRHFWWQSVFTWVNVCTSDFAKTSSQHLLGDRNGFHERCVFDRLSAMSHLRRSTVQHSTRSYRKMKYIFRDEQKT